MDNYNNFYARRPASRRRSIPKGNEAVGKAETPHGRGDGIFLAYLATDTAQLKK